MSTLWYNYGIVFEGKVKEINDKAFLGIRNGTPLLLFFVTPKSLVTYIHENVSSKKIFWENFEIKVVLYPDLSACLKFTD